MSHARKLENLQPLPGPTEGLRNPRPAEDEILTARELVGAAELAHVSAVADEAL